jgi:hypothetical protein
MQPGRHHRSWCEPPRATLVYKELESNLGSRLLIATLAGAIGTSAMDALVVPQISPRRRNRPAVRLGVLGRSENLGGRFGPRARRQRCAVSTPGPRAAPGVGQVSAERGALGHRRGVECSACASGAASEALRVDMGRGNRPDRLDHHLSGSAVRQDLQTDLGLRRQSTDR